MSDTTKHTDLKTSFRDSLKSLDTEETIDIYFTAP